MDVLAIRDDRTLRRIVATLTALALLAERVSGRSYPVRCLVLCILLPAEAVARTFLAETTRILPPALEETPAIQNGPADAIALAMRFRALAAALGALLWLTRRFARSNGGIYRAALRYGPRAGRLSITPGDWTRRPNDTS